MFPLVGALLAAPSLGTAPTALLAAPQAAEVLLPEQSAAKAKDLIHKAIQALGGTAYLGVRDISCQGRFSQFSPQGELTGYNRFFDFVKLPDKNRTEYSKKRNIIGVNNADQGWEMDRGGVQDSTAESIERFQESLKKKNIDYLFRYRLHEPGLAFRYAGTEVLDLRQVDWVELVDSDRRTMKIAFDQSTHLPLRAIYILRDRQTRERIEELEYFSVYHSVQGVQTPFQVARERNARKVFQVFYESCQYNTGLADSFFTRESLEQRFAELNKGKKKK